MIKIFKGDIVIGDPMFIKLDNIRDSLVMPIGLKDGFGTLYWAQDSVKDLKYYKKSLTTKSIDQELGDFCIDSGYICIGLWEKESKPEDESIVYLTNYNGPVELWQDRDGVAHALGYGNIRFYSQWKNI